MAKSYSLITHSIKCIDYDLAWKAALFLAVIVYGINFSHGEQAAYTFFVAGVITRLCDVLARKQHLGSLSTILAIVIPSFIAITLTFLLHSLKGTPEPLYSTLPTMLMAPLGFAGLAWRYRKLAAGNTRSPGADYMGDGDQLATPTNENKG